MKLSIEINVDNDAFQDEFHGSAEIGRILARIPGNVANGETEGNCRDWNGNKVGQWKITEGGN